LLLLTFTHRPYGTTVTVPPESVLTPSLSVGDVVTFSFDANVRRDVPTNPKIFRIRTDVLWDEIVQSYTKEKQSLGGTRKEKEIRIGILTLNNFSKFICERIYV
jgi:hypothetical protein